MLLPACVVAITAAEPGKVSTRAVASAVSAADLPSCSVESVKNGHFGFLSDHSFRGSTPGGMYGEVFLAGGGASRFQPSSSEAGSTGKVFIGAGPTAGPPSNPPGPPAGVPAAPPANGGSPAEGLAPTVGTNNPIATGTVAAAATGLAAATSLADDSPDVAPEPGTLLLLGVGLSGLAALRRRSRRGKRTIDLLVVLLAVASLAACSRGTFGTFFSSGETYFAAGQYPEAAIQFENAVRLDRNALAAQLKLGKTYVALNRPDKAIKVYQHAVALDPVAPDARIGLAELYLETDRPTDGENQLRAMLDSSVGDAAATNMYRYLVDATQCSEPSSGLLAIADYYMWSGRPDDAVRVLKPLATGDRSAAAIARMAAIVYDRGDHAEAARLIDALLVKDPSNVEGLLLQARMSLNEGEIHEAHEFAKKAAALAPDAPAVRTVLAAMK